MIKEILGFLFWIVAIAFVLGLILGLYLSGRIGTGAEEHVGALFDVVTGGGRV